MRQKEKRGREERIRRTEPFTVNKLDICFTFSDLGFEVLNFKQSLQSKLEFRESIFPGFEFLFGVLLLRHEHPMPVIIRGCLEGSMGMGPKLDSNGLEFQSS